jgi:hypothetical protein
MSAVKQSLFDSGKAFKRKFLCSFTINCEICTLSNFMIEGHTDSDGSNLLNQTLSENRGCGRETT